MFSSIIDSTTSVLTIQNVLMCTVVSALLGLLIAVIYRKESDSSKNFFISLVMLPVLVQTVIMMVSGNLGTAVAVAGTFSLVRFRSMQGTAREIVYVFFAMAIGLATGMGYVTFAALIAVMGSIIYLLVSRISFPEDSENEKELRITIAEDLDYTNALDDVLNTYTSKYSLYRVKTVSLGSMYELRYRVTLKDISKEKEMLDEIRIRNGNLTVVSSRYVGNMMSL
ncbi:MAG: DUF4956 domain-containing protein [Erysipelotrichales bacterium]|nr:DUF4956 domain-containing protein [Erysipelotrichales bacterium]